MPRNRYIPLISTVPRAVPSVNGMFNGELAVNIADGKLYTKSGSFIIALNEFNTTGFVSSSQQIISLISGAVISPTTVNADTFIGNLVGTASTASYVRLTDIDNFANYSQSIKIKIEDLEFFSASLDDTFATDSELSASAFILQANINEKVSISTFDQFLEVYNTGSFSGSFTGSLSYTNLVDVPSGIVSSSSQITEIELDKLDINGGDASFTITGSVISNIFAETRKLEPPIPMDIYSGASIEYTAQRQNAIRTGIIMASWSGSEVTYTDISNSDIGDTSDITFSIVQSMNKVQLRVVENSEGNGENGWNVKVLYKLFPNLM